MLPSFESAVVRKVLTLHPFQMFPLLENEKVLGAVTRTNAEAALKVGGRPMLQPVVVCRPDDSIKQTERSMVDQGATMAVVIPENGTEVTGILTLHDLVRAQLAASDHADDAG